MDWPRRLNQARALPVVLCVAVALSLSSCHPVDEGRRGPDETVVLSLPEIDPAMTLLPPDQWSDFTVSRGALFRVEIPAEMADSLWAYVRARYEGRDRSGDPVAPALSRRWSAHRVVDHYFDSADLALRRRGSWLRLRMVDGRDESGIRGSGRSVVQLGGRLAGSEAGRRRIEFRVHVPRPGARRSFAHEVIGMVDQSERRAFRHALEALGTAPERTYRVFTLQGRQRTLDVMDGREVLWTIALIESGGRKWWEEVRFASLEVVPHVPSATGADSARKARVARSIVSFEQDLRAAFPLLPATRHSDYDRAFHELDEAFVRFDLALRINAPVEALLGGILLLMVGAAGLLVLKASPGHG